MSRSNVRAATALSLVLTAYAATAACAQEAQDQAAPSPAANQPATSELPSVDVIQEQKAAPDAPQAAPKSKAETVAADETPAPPKPVKRKTAKVAAKPAPSAPQPEAQQSPLPAETANEITATALPGTLIVSEDDFTSTVTVTARDIAATRGATIADALATRPGVNATSFAPGASRPIVRGLDGNRVRMQENGIGTHDVSTLSEDHAVPVDPFAADRVEVIRGPATLRYGSQAGGAVVSIENDRVPSAVPVNGISGEVRGGAAPSMTAPMAASR